MVNLIVHKNLVMINKEDPSCSYFVNKYLIKYETMTVPDRYNSDKNHKKFKTVKEMRCLFTEGLGFIYFSRGILEMIPKYEYTLDDRSRYKIKTPELSMEEISKTLDVFDLRIDQTVAVNKCLLLKRGVIQLPTAVGKSAIIAATIKRLHQYNRDMKSLVIAPTLSTVENIYDTFKENNIDASIFGHPDKNFKSPVTVALVQSLIDENYRDELERINAVFYDECLPGKAKVLTPKGYVRISTIFGNNEINEVISLDINTNTYVTKKILRKFKTPYNQKFYQISYKHRVSGLNEFLSCTPNHKILVKRNETISYIQAQEIVPGDLIYIDYPVIRDCSSSFNEFRWSEVVKVVGNKGGVVEWKYNIEVEDTHCYFADNVLVSNCHHLKCDTWNKLNTLLPNVEYSLGFSALSINKNEINKTDFSELSYDASLIVGSSGRVLMHMDPSYYIEKGIIAFPVVFRVSHCHKFKEGFDESQWHQVVKLGLMSTIRTDKVARVSSIFSRYNRKVLILVSEKDYAFEICKFLVNYGVKDFGVSFGAGKGYLYKSHKVDEFVLEDGRVVNEVNIDYEKEDSLEVLNKLSTGEISVLIGTSHLDEGVDVKNLDAVILASGGKKDRRIIQRLGRVLRKSKEGKYAYIIDFTDDGSKVLSKQSKSRLEMYKKVIGVPKEKIFDGILVDDIECKFKELEEI